jgi:hypothetical protein
MMAPEFTTNVLEEHATFSRPINELDTYLKSVLGIEQGKKYGETIPVTGGPKEKFSAARIKSLLEEIADPLFTHVSLVRVYSSSWRLTCSANHQLQHEIEWLDPEKIRASGITSQRLSVIEERSDEHLQARMVRPSSLQRFHSYTDERNSAGQIHVRLFLGQRAAVLSVSGGALVREESNSPLGLLVERSCRKCPFIDLCI